MLLFLTLLCVPSIALVILDANLSGSTVTVAAWIFAAYFAAAWLLLLGVIVRPDYVTTPMLAVVVVIALVTQAPLAIVLESALPSTDTTFGLSIAAVGVPEELVKAIPVLAVALLFGAVSSGRATICSSARSAAWPSAPASPLLHH